MTGAQLASFALNAPGALSMPFPALWDLPNHIDLPFF